MTGCRTVFFCDLAHLVGLEEALVGPTLKRLCHERFKSWTVFGWRSQQLEKITTTTTKGL